MSGNPVDMQFHVKAPTLDPVIDGKISSRLDLASIQQVYPLEDISLKGVMEAGLNLQGQLSTLERGEYEQFHASGSFRLSDFVMQSSLLPEDLGIKAANLAFSPRFIALNEFSGNIGKNDFQLDGQIDNYLLYAFQGKTLKGTFNHYSENLNINSLMPKEAGEEATADTVGADTSAMELIRIPQNLDLRFTSRIDWMQYDKLEIDDFQGNIRVKEGIAYLDNLSMNALDGSMQMSGKYDTQDPDKALAGLNMDMKHVSIPATYKAFNTIQSLAPIGKQSTGDMYLRTSFPTRLDQQINPVLSSVEGQGRLSSREIGLENSRTFAKVASALGKQNMDELVLKDVNINFEIRKGRVYVDPFTVRPAGIKTTVSGSQGIDQTLDYLFQMDVPKSQFGKAGEQVLNKLLDNPLAKSLNIGQSETLPVNIKLTGDINDPQAALVLDPSRTGGQQSATQQVKQKAKEEVKQVVEDQKQKVKEEASRQAEKILQEAREEARRVENQAQKLAAEIRKEGDRKAEQILEESEGKNILVRKAAEESAKKIRKEADAKADKIEEEAAEKARKIIQEAEEEAKRLE